MDIEEPKLINLLDDFKKYSGTALGALLGINCYQFALGITIIPISVLNKNDNPSIFFHTLTPGFKDAFNQTRECPDNGNLYKQYIIDGCINDGLIDVGNKLPDGREGFMTVALYFSPKGDDFHFVIHSSDNRWWDKTVNNLIKIQNTFPVFDDYIFDRFLRVPKTLEKLDPYPQSKDWMITSNNRRYLSYKIIKDLPKTLCGFRLFSAETNQGEYVGVIPEGQMNGKENTLIVPLPNLPACAVNYISPA